ncbi:uncharacterized protein LOC124259985 isoform X2 [Haliotis rubra]|nr:uncharacterized protein LOC124259985 isoform X2 [Haliotis rubra]
MRVCLALYCLTHLCLNLCLLPGTQPTPVTQYRGKSCTISSLVVEENGKKCKISNSVFQHESRVTAPDCSLALDLRCNTGSLQGCTKTDPPTCIQFPPACTRIIYSRTDTVTGYTCTESDYVGSYNRQE